VRRNLSRYLKRPLASGAAAMLVAALLAACGSSKAPAARVNPAGPITIGVSLSLTGSSASDFSADGRAFERGYELWSKDVNADGGLLGRQVKLRIVNDGSSPEQAVTNYQTLIGSDHVNLIFGAFSSVLTTPASTVAARYGMALVEAVGEVLTPAARIEPGALAARGCPVGSPFLLDGPANVCINEGHDG
jgi:branched-chain amino acid transport system substrate-binding protein